MSRTRSGCISTTTTTWVSTARSARQRPWLIDRVDGKITTLAAFRRSEEPDDWKRLMSDHLVRRTRSFIKANYAEKADGREYLTFANGQPFFFPRRKAHPIEHTFGKKDPARLMVQDSTLDVVDHLLLPRYSLASHLNRDAAPNKREQEVIDRLQRASGHLTGFVRTGLTSASRPAGTRSFCRSAATLPVTRCGYTRSRTGAT